MSKMYTIESTGTLHDISPNYVTWGARVIEKATGLTIVDDVRSDYAKIICKHLNGGKGFRGHTPRFFLDSLI